MKQAIILAAGEGQRLRPLTASRPKVMLKAAGKPIIGYVIESLIACSIRNIVIVAGYRRDQLFDALGDGSSSGVNIRYVIQEHQAGTGHALKQAESLADNEFLLLPGDHLIEAATIREICMLDPLALLVKRIPNDQTVRYGAVSISGGEVKEITEKPAQPCDKPVSTGIFKLDKTIFQHLGQVSDIPAAINTMVAKGARIRAVEADGAWLDAIYPWDLLELNNHALKTLPPDIRGTLENGVFTSGATSIGTSSRIRSGSYLTGPALIGGLCNIGPAAIIGPGVSIGDSVSVGAFCVITNSIIGDDVVIGPGAVIENSIIGPGCSIGANFSSCSGEAEIKVGGEWLVRKAGSIIGENCRLEASVVVSPGVVLGNESSVMAMKNIAGRFADGSRVV
jgi:UDP-N-acetylglucosamine diphosphorylase / glucose-1-phosphate thymidylyltransferase / UDP-N-acetylgalactosamine diphosphorylase / glucosamine-1-phosphate N-acetyltransferase / galactosamine-1-phosphate N-acetyltransferase